jgi:hypothetical protein
MAVELSQLVACDPPQPEKKGHCRETEVCIQVLPGFEVRVLKNIGGVNPPLEPLIQAESDHPTQALATLSHQGFPTSCIPLGGSPQSLIGLASLIRHPRSHVHVFLLSVDLAIGARNEGIP